MIFAQSLHTLLSTSNLDDKDPKTVECHTALQGKLTQEAHTCSNLPKCSLDWLQTRYVANSDLEFLILWLELQA